MSNAWQIRSIKISIDDELTNKPIESNGNVRFRRGLRKQNTRKNKIITQIIVPQAHILLNEFDLWYFQPIADQNVAGFVIYMKFLYAFRMALRSADRIYCRQCLQIKVLF